MSELEKERVKLSNGEEIEVRELSVIQFLDLVDEGFSVKNEWKKCISDEDWKKLEKAPRKDIKTIREAIDRVNGRDKKDPKDKDFPNAEETSQK